MGRRGNREGVEGAKVVNEPYVVYGPPEGANGPHFGANGPPGRVR